MKGRWLSMCLSKPRRRFLIVMTEISCEMSKNNTICLWECLIDYECFLIERCQSLNNHRGKHEIADLPYWPLPIKIKPVWRQISEWNFLYENYSYTTLDLKNMTFDGSTCNYCFFILILTWRWIQRNSESFEFELKRRITAA